MISVEQNQFLQFMIERTSIRHYDPNVVISKEKLKELLKIAGKAPSAWNLQHWHFVVFHSQTAKERLLPIANHQQQIVDSSAVVAVLGDLQANQKTNDVYQPLVDEGHMTEEIKKTLAGQIERAYQNQQFARDAAFTNASLGAMQLILAAKAEGYDTCPIGGFDKKAFMKEFNISERYIPVMLITIGKALKPAHKSNRLPVEQLSTWL